MLGTTAIEDLTTERIREQLARIDQSTLSELEVRRMQGSAGVQDLYTQMRNQVFGSAGA
jgi:hypothetical protein